MAPPDNAVSFAAPQALIYSRGEEVTTMNGNLVYYRPPQERDERIIQTDVCIYGANAAGVAAALQLTREGKGVIVLEPGIHLGGLTTGGLGCTDFGNKAVIGGISREFYKEVGKHYGVDEEWNFEPSVASKVLKGWVERNHIPVYFSQYLQSVVKDGQRLTALTTESGMTVRASVFIDCSYEGDLMAKAGVSYHVGREGNATYGETLNGTQVHKTHQFHHPVDPYVVPGDASSGLLPHIDSDGPLPPGTADKRVQAYNFRLCLTKKPENRVSWTEPEGYNPQDYELLGRYMVAGGVQDTYGKYDKIRGEKVDKNNHGAVSTDFIGANWNYPEADYATREKIFQAHVRWHQGLFWFLSTDERVPADARKWVGEWGLCKDEFVDTGGWSPQLYIREARRMVGGYVVIEQDCRHQRTPDDSVGMGAYNMDSHNCRRFVQDGKVYNEGDVQVAPTGPYPVSMRALLPKGGECENLIVPVCLSASHIAYGSVRMEPVFMILGQSAAILASQVLDDKNAPVQSLTYAKIRPRLEKAEQVLYRKG
jgi:hypothetical protein